MVGAANIEQHRYKLFTVGAIGTFMGTLDGSILNVALPTLADSFGCDIHIVAWVTLAYMLTLISFMMVFGAWTERKGYGFAYRFAYVFFTAGSLLAALSSSIWMLVGARVVQALGASMFQAVGTGMVTTVFPPEERGKGIGLMVMMVSAGLMTGPLIGGLLLSAFPWQSIFVINIPIGLVGLGLTLRYFRNLPAPRPGRKLRLAGAACLSVFLGAGMMALTQISEGGAESVRVLGLGALALAGLAGFVRFESDPDRALIGVRSFRNRQFSISLAAMVTMFVAMSGTLVLIPFYLERVQGLDPGAVGLYLMVLPVMMFIFAPLSGRLSDRIGYRALTTFGVLSMLLGLYLLGRIGIDTTAARVIAGLAAVGCGVGIFNTPNSSAFMGAAGADQRAVASGLLSATRNIGMAAGIALATSLFAWFELRYGGQGSDPQVFVRSFRQVLHVELAIGAVAVPLCLFRFNRVRAPSKPVPRRS
jgi:EmrB/QacA subfamily drug resistance transporter